MPVVTPPSSPYSQPQWEADPKNKPQTKDGKPAYEKYDYATGESLASIASSLSQPGQTVTADDIATLNWGTTTPGEINYYLTTYNGCRENADHSQFVLDNTDRRPWLWVPKVAPPAPVGKVRSPGKVDVGHVAPDHAPKKHINTLVVPPVYAITLELGDIDALFDAMDPASDHVQPWTKLGVRQRLQVLGYLYTPMGRSSCVADAEKCWTYYKMVHDRKRGMLVIHNDPVATQTAATVQVTGSAIVLTITGGASAGTDTLAFADGDKNTLEKLAVAINGLNKGWRARANGDAAAASSGLVAVGATDAMGPSNQQLLRASNLSNTELLAILKQEVQNNVLTRTFPRSGVVFHNSRLPKRGEFGIIRFPGGYTMTWPRPGTKFSDPKPTDPDAKYDLSFDDPHFNLEKNLVDDNDIFQKIPLIATVHRVLPDGTVEPAENVSVYFQLAEPEDLPAGYKAKELRNAVMDYSKNAWFWDGYLGTLANPPPSTNPADWNRAKQLVAEAFAAGDRGAAQYINSQAVSNRVKGFMQHARSNDNPPLGVMDSDSDWGVAKPHKPSIASAESTARNTYVDTLGETQEVKAALRTMLGKAYQGKPITAAPGPNLPPFEITNRGPKKFVDDVLTAVENDAKSVDAKDPQRTNAPSKWGGKATLPVAGNIFEIKERAGFHSRRDTKHRDYGKLHVAQAVTASSDGRHKYAVCAKTNEKGYAGVIFMPARCGGDRYRLRAYVGPESLEFPTTVDFSGPDADGPFVETGTMVVWRNIRFYRYLRKESVQIAAMSQTAKDMILWPTANGGTDYKGKKQWADPYKEMDLASNVAKLDIGNGWPEGAEATYRKIKPAGKEKFYRPVDVDYNSLADHFRQCYCELILDTDRVEHVSQALHALAVQRGGQVAAASGATTKQIDWSKLVFADEGSPFLLNLRHWTHYNELTKPIGSASRTHPELVEADEKEVRAAVDPYMIDEMLRVFSDGGVYPGLTLVQFPRGDTWEDYTLKGEFVFTSGIAAPARAAFVFYTEKLHRDRFCYSATSNALHELGHVLMGEHQDVNPGGDPAKHETHPAQFKMTPAAGETVCIMSYTACYGEYCGRCVLRMRGWLSKSRTQLAGV